MLAETHCFVLQHLDTEDAHPLHLGWIFLAREIKGSVWIFFKLFIRDYTDIDIIYSWLIDHQE
jgi:hypothetical protein